MRIGLAILRQAGADCFIEFNAHHPVEDHVIARCTVFQFAILFVAGCGGSDAGNTPDVILGTVTFDGEPIPKGEITFLAEDGTSSHSGKITNGTYRVPTTAGKKTVQIQGWKIIPGGRKGANGEPIPQEYIPDRYGQRSTVTIEVVAGRPNQQDFKLESK